MSPYRFQRVLVAIDGSEGAQKALDCALSICESVDAELTVLAVEGKLPAYAGSIGEVDEVKREKDTFFSGVLDERPRAGAASAASRSRPISYPGTLPRSSRTTPRRTATS